MWRALQADQACWEPSYAMAIQACKSAAQLGGAFGSPWQSAFGGGNGACDAGRFLPYNMVETSRLLARIFGQNRGHYWHLENAPTGHEVSTIRDKKPPSLCENGNLFRQRRYPSRLSRIS